MPRDFTLVKTKRNDVFRMVEASGLNPTDFVWETQRSRYMRLGPPVSKLVHGPTGHFFVFDLSEDMMGRESFISIFSPGRSLREEVLTASVWSEQIDHVGVWLRLLSDEVEEPDLWGSLVQATLPAEILETPRTRFTPEEQAEVLARLDELTRQIVALEALTREQKEMLGAELRRIGDAVRRMDRADWLRVAVGGMLTVLLSGSFQQTLAASLLRWAVSAFHGMVTGTPPPPLLLPP